VLALVAFFAASPRRAWCSASGLDNIPTTDTPPHLTLVIQQYSLAGKSRRPDHITGFKFGIDPWSTKKWRNRFEVGIDNHPVGGGGGPAVAQVKFASQPDPRGPAFSVGLANVARNPGDAVRPFWYGMLSQDLQIVRLHGGYGIQAGDNNTVLVGIDRTVRLFGRTLIVRADAVQINHRKDWLASYGGLYAFTKHVVFEAWWSDPTAQRPGFITAKLNFVIDFRKN
jgi:hypothetical protein